MFVQLVHDLEPDVLLGHVNAQVEELVTLDHHDFVELLLVKAGLEHLGPLFLEFVEVVFSQADLPGHLEVAL